MRALAEAEGLLAQIAERLPHGDAATDLGDQLMTQIDQITRFVRTLGPDRPAEVATRLADLAHRLHASVTVGDEWLNQTAHPEALLRERVLRAYQPHGHSRVELGSLAPAASGQSDSRPPGLARLDPV